MKRSFCIVTLLLVLGGIGLAQQITVTEPASGMTWNWGGTYVIRWTTDLPPGSRVKITLWQGEGRIMEVGEEINDGTYAWQVPGSLAPGTYKIRVRAIGAEIVGISAAFNISNAQIVVTQPTAGATWNPGETRLIQWTHTGPVPDKVLIRLYPKASEAIIVDPGTANDGSYSYTLPAVLPSAEWYQIFIATPDLRVVAWSPHFNVSSPRKLAAARDPAQMRLKFPALSISDVKLVPYEDSLVITFAYKNSGTGPLPKASEMPVKPNYRVLIDNKDVARGDLFIPAFEAQPGWEVPSFFGYEIKYQMSVFDENWTVGNLVTVKINENKVNGMASDSQSYNLKPMALNYSYDVMVGGLTYDWDRMLLTFTVRIDGNIGSFNKFRYRGTYANNIMDRTIDIIPGKRLYTIERVLDKAGTSRTELYVAILVSLVETPSSPDDRRDIEHRNNRSAYTFRR